MHDVPVPQDRRLGDFAHVDEADAGNLVARLDAMHLLQSFRIYKQQTFGLLRLAPGASVADVGCGTGDDARALTTLVAEGGTVVGFDLSEEMLAQARDRHAGAAGLTFVRAASDDLTAPDASFDGVRCDRVLIHVPDPKASLAEMVRVTRPGGRIVISEPDMPGCWVASDDYATTERIMAEIAHSCLHPFLPRDLWAMAHDAGLTDVSLTVAPVTVFDPGAVGRILDFSGVVSGMVAKGLLTPSAASTWIDGMAERGRTGRFVAGLSIMILAATKS